VRGHADAATLAAFREELLSARKAAQVSAHLAACPRCAALEAQLAEVTTLLNRATAPPMPDALTARIQAALTAEAAARTPADAPATERVPAMRAATVKGDGEAGGGTQSSNGHRAGEPAGRRTGWRGHDRSWLALRVAAVTAAVAVIAGGGYGVSQLLSAGSAEHQATSSANGAALSPNIKVKGPVPGMGAGGTNSAPSASPSTSGGLSTLAPLVVSSGTNYQPATLGTQARTVLEHLTHSTHQVPLAPTRSQASFSAQLRPCLIHIRNGQRLLLADLARYKGHPALIVVLPSPNGGQLRVLVIAPGCTATTALRLASTTLAASP
jgi:predicted anti-sigma-YlaC factor YlaD